jgi:membrane protease YdiL (CAAX protease family)
VVGGPSKVAEVSEQPPHPQVPPFVTPAGETTGDVPWGFLDAAAVFGLSFLLMAVASPLLGALDDPELARGLFFPLSLALLGGTAVVWVRLRHPGHVGALLRRRPTAADAAMGVAHGFAAFFIINVGFGLVVRVLGALTGLELPEVQEGLREAALDGRIGVLVIVSAVLVAPLAEEVFFRGLLYQGLRGPLGTWPAIALSALLFGLAHFEAGNLAGSLYALLVLSSFGAYLAWALERRSLVAPVAMHATFNALAVVGILLART